MCLFFYGYLGLMLIHIWKKMCSVRRWIDTPKQINKYDFQIYEIIYKYIGSFEIHKHHRGLVYMNIFPYKINQIITNAP